MQSQNVRCKLLPGFVLVMVAFVALFGQAVQAGGIVETSVQTTDANPISLDVNQKDIRNATRDLVDGTGAYTAIANRPFVAVYNVGGAKNLLKLQADATGQNITLTSPSSGKSQIFTGANREQAIDRLNDFLQTDLNAAFGQFQKSLNTQTGVGVTDGNPLAATAFLADDVFTQFGFVPTVSQASKDAIGRFEIGVQGGGGTYSVNNGTGNFAKMDINAGMKFNDQVGFVLSIPVQYRTIGGTNTYIGGINLGLPITILHHDVLLDGMAWQLTPWVDVGGGINEPLLSGGGIYGGGGTSSLAYQAGPLTFTLADQIGYDSGFAFTYDNIKFDTPVNQWIMKNGMRADYQFAQSCFFDAGLAYTNFLASAAIRNYLTPSAGIGFRWGQYGSSSFQVNYVGNFGNDNYRDNGVQLILQIRF
jgi:hypothetical protein